MKFGCRVEGAGLAKTGIKKGETEVFDLPLNRSARWNEPGKHRTVSQVAGGDLLGHPTQGQYHEPPVREPKVKLGGPSGFGRAGLACMVPYRGSRE